MELLLIFGLKIRAWQRGWEGQRQLLGGLLLLGRNSESYGADGGPVFIWP